MKKVDEGHYLLISAPPAKMHKEKIFRRLVADVIFGSPRSKCAGTGLCRILGPEDRRLLDRYPCCQKASAKISWLAEWIVFEFRKDRISLAAYERHFYDGYFMVQDTLEYLPKGWPVSYKIRISPGCYSAHESEQYLKLYFERSPKEPALVEIKTSKIKS